MFDLFGGAMQIGLTYACRIAALLGGRNNLDNRTKRNPSSCKFRRNIFTIGDVKGANGLVDESRDVYIGFPPVPIHFSSLSQWYQDQTAE